MESNSEKLKEYVMRESKFLRWGENQDHEVVFLGYELSVFTFKSGKAVPTVRYFFRLSNGLEKPIDVRSVAFSDLMSQYSSGDRLLIRRDVIGNNKYVYKVSKIG